MIIIKETKEIKEMVKLGTFTQKRKRVFYDREKKEEKELKKIRGKRSQQKIKKKYIYSQAKNMDEFKELLYQMNVNSNLSKCHVDEYLNLMRSKYNYRHHYKTPKSNLQIKSLVEISIEFDPNFFLRLIAIICKRFNPKVYGKIHHILMSNKTDNQIYKDLHNLYLSPENRGSHINLAKACSKEKIFADDLKGYLEKNIGTSKIEKVKYFLDIGAGDCKFTREMSKNLNLIKSQTFGIDVESFAEQKDWKRDTSGVTYQTINPENDYPFTNNRFDIITLIMVLHHIENIQFTLNQISRVLKNNQYLIIMDHDAFTYGDYMLCDIEHSLFQKVYDRNPNFEETADHEGGYTKYRNWLEIDYILREYNFFFIDGGIYSQHINRSQTPTRSFWAIYQIKKNSPGVSIL